MFYPEFIVTCGRVGLLEITSHYQEQNQTLCILYEKNVYSLEIILLHRSNIVIYLTENIHF